MIVKGVQVLQLNVNERPVVSEQREKVSISTIESRISMGLGYSFEYPADA